MTLFICSCFSQVVLILKHNDFLFALFDSRKIHDEYYYDTDEQRNNYMFYFEYDIVKSWWISYYLTDIDTKVSIKGTLFVLDTHFYTFFH